MNFKIFLIPILVAMASEVYANSPEDTTIFVATYQYSVNTQDDEGNSVIDSTRLSLLVSQHATLCEPTLDYHGDGRPNGERTSLFRMHIPSAYTDLNLREVVSVEALYPYRYVTHEPMTETKWTLTNDTLTIGNMFCHCATGKLHGKTWKVWYTEEIPSSAGPWKLRGLPGLIVKAADAENIHQFVLDDLKKERKQFGVIGKNPSFQKISRKKFVAFKKRVLGNKRYPKEPTYYVPEGAEDIIEINVNGNFINLGMNTHMIVLEKSYVYQPLELE